jgi:cytochrome P450
MDWREGMLGATANAVVLRQFPWIFPLLKATPLPIMRKLDSNAAGLMAWSNSMRKETDVLLAKNAGGKRAEGTIFQAILDSDLPSYEKRAERLTEEAQIVVGGGTETTAEALSFITFFVYSDHSMLRKLRNEIETIDSGPDGSLTLAKLEKLPYLVS